MQVTRVKHFRACTTIIATKNYYQIIMKKYKNHNPNLGSSLKDK